MNRRGFLRRAAAALVAVGGARALQAAPAPRPAPSVLVGLPALGIRRFNESQIAERVNPPVVGENVVTVGSGSRLCSGWLLELGPGGVMKSTPLGPVYRVP